MGMGKKKILVVDDHLDSRLLLVRMLVRDGYDAKGAGTKAEALALCQSESFDLLISDLGLPDGDGKELMRDVAALYRTPGISYTGNALQDELDAASEAGFSAHLIKPVEYSDVQRMVAEMLKERPD